MTAPTPASQGTLVLIADFRSPHARTWVDACERIFDRVVILSSFPEDGRALSRGVRLLTPSLRGVFSDTVPATAYWRRAGIHVRHWLRWRQAEELAARIQQTCHQVQADHVHALRMPWEGVAAHLSGRTFSVSLWGSDLAAQAPQSALLAERTRGALRRCAGLTADCRHDLELAELWGLPVATPRAVIPGDVSLSAPKPARPQRSGENVLRVCCPRGLLPHVRWREMITATAQLNASGARIHLTILDASGDRMPAELPFVTYLPKLAKHDMLALARRTDVVLSPTTSDGIPNSVLEFVIAGAVPVLGDLPSTRELVENGVNGLLCDPLDATSIAGALRTLVEPRLREQLAAGALQTVRREYSAPSAQDRLERFFGQVLAGDP